MGAQKQKIFNGLATALISMGALAPAWATAQERVPGSSPLAEYAEKFGSAVAFTDNIPAIVTRNAAPMSHYVMSEKATQACTKFDSMCFHVLFLNDKKQVQMTVAPVTLIVPQKLISKLIPRAQNSLSARPQIARFDGKLDIRVTDYQNGERVYRIYDSSYADAHPGIYPSLTFEVFPPGNPLDKRQPNKYPSAIHVMFQDGQSIASPNLWIERLDWPESCDPGEMCEPWVQEYVDPALANEADGKRRPVLRNGPMSNHLEDQPLRGDAEGRATGAGD
jgi:hypothetical protein